MNNLSIIAAVSSNNAIGLKNKLPWYIPLDFQYFKDTTVGNVVVMGRHTYQSIGKTLTDRISIVFSKQSTIKGVVTVPDLASFFALLEEKKESWIDKEIFIIGGAAIFELFIPYTSTLYLTRIYHDFKADTFFPEIDYQKWNIVSKEKGIRNENNDYDYEYLVLKRIKKPNKQEYRNEN